MIARLGVGDLFVQQLKDKHPFWEHELLGCVDAIVQFFQSHQLLMEARRDTNFNRFGLLHIIWFLRNAFVIPS